MTLDLQILATAAHLATLWLAGYLAHGIYRERKQRAAAKIQREQMRRELETAQANMRQALSRMLGECDCDRCRAERASAQQRAN